MFFNTSHKFFNASFSVILLLMYYLQHIFLKFRIPYLWHPQSLLFLLKSALLDLRYMALRLLLSSHQAIHFCQGEEECRKCRVWQQMHRFLVHKAANCIDFGKFIDLRVEWKCRTPSQHFHYIGASLFGCGGQALGLEDDVSLLCHTPKTSSLISPFREIRDIRDCRLMWMN